MAFKITFLLFLIAAFEMSFIHTSPPPDYTYIAATGASYKAHELANWNDARDTCRSKGGLLFHPNDEEELNQVIGRLIGDNYAIWIHTGISDLEILKQYKTLDGRPVSEVYNKWTEGEPDSCFANSCRCGSLNTYSRTLQVSDCEQKNFFICKIKGEEVVKTEIEQMKTNIANISNKMTALEQQKAHQPSLILERIAEAIANQAAALERIAETDANRTAALERMMANQAAAIKRIAETDSNHTAALKRMMANQAAAIQQLTSAVQQQTAEMRLQSVYQIASMERQALALEKLASSEDTNGGQPHQ